MPWTKDGGIHNNFLEHRLTVSREGEYISIDDEFSNPHIEDNEFLRTAMYSSFNDKKPMIIDYGLQVDGKVGVKLIFDDLNSKNKSGNIYPLGEEEKRASSGSIAFMPFYYRDSEHPSGIVFFEGNLRCKGSEINGVVSTIWSATATMVAARQMSNMLTHKFDAITVLTKSADFTQDFRDDIRKLMGKVVKGVHLGTIDIDNFRIFNKRYGRQIGDDVLRAVADAIKTSVRSDDAVSRVGGEEFCVILRNVSQSEAVVIAERIRKNVAEKKIETGGRMLGVTISLGLATVDSISERILRENNFSSEEDLIKKIYKTAENESDYLMRTAKQQGRNRICVGDVHVPTPV
jgi:diguanylate cyclase (GGDEF)-like protein